jgi:uncharacterized protein (DUF1778 family)
MSVQSGIPAMVPSVLRVRFNKGERALLEGVCRHARMNLTEYVRRKALHAAYTELCSEQIIIPAAHWKEFEAWMTAPGREIPALKELAESLPTWSKRED